MPGCRSGAGGPEGLLPKARFWQRILLPARGLGRGQCYG